MSAADRFLASQERKRAKREKARASMSGPEGDRRRAARWDRPPLSEEEKVIRAREARARYRTTSKGRETQHRYESGPKRAEARVRYQLRLLARDG